MPVTHLPGSRSRLLVGLPSQRAATSLAIAALFGFAMTGCQHTAATTAADSTTSQATATASQPAASPQPASAEQPFEQSQTYYQVLLGQVAQQRGEQQVALSNLLAAAEASRDVSLARQAFGLALKQRDPDATLRAATLLAELESTNPEARMALALAQFQNEQGDAALLSLEQALGLLGSNENAQLGLLGKFARAAGPGSLPLITELSHRHPNPEWLLLAAAVQAQHFGDGPYAMALLDQAIDTAPDYRRALLVKAELLANRDGDAAIALLDEAYRQHRNDRELAVAYGRTLYGQGRFPEAVNVLRAPAKDADDKEAGYLYAVSLFMAGDWADAQPLLQAIAEAGEQTGPAGWLCGQAAERIKQQKQALTCYDLVEPEANQFVPAQRSKAELLAQSGQLDAALDALVEARIALAGVDDSDAEALSRRQGALLFSQLQLLRKAKRIADAKALFADEPIAYRKQWEPALFEATLGKASPDLVLSAFQALRPEAEAARRQWALAAANLLQQEGLLKQALQLLDDELAALPDQIDLLYARALIAEPLGAERTEADLRRVLALDANHIDALNALGYTLADHNRQLDEAYNLIDRALRARPTSAAIMDSMGWLYFRRGELDKAKDWLGRAYALEPEAEIAAHYGEVLYRLGEKRRARQIWREALDASPDNRVLKAVIERLK